MIFLKVFVSVIAVFLLALPLFAQDYEYCNGEQERCLESCCIRYGGTPGGISGCSEGFEGNYPTLCYVPCDEEYNLCLQGSQGGWDDGEYDYGPEGGYESSGSCCGGAFILAALGTACVLVAGRRMA